MRVSHGFNIHMELTQAQRPQTPAKSSARSQTLAPVQEIFSSIQGEGVHIGKRQAFVRFAHCHLKCAYCDTPMTSSTGQCHVETSPGSGQMELMDNPMTPDALLAVLENLLTQGRHHSVSLTGGEPLLYHTFLREVLPAVQRRCKTYLETSGTQPEFLQHVLPWTDIIAMDIKLPSTTGEASRFAEHQVFYEVARSRPETELFIKLIFGEETPREELEAVKSIVTDRSTPIILQPVTSLADKRVYVSPAKMIAVQEALLDTFTDVRVIPQSHKMLGVL